jgi:hypothetical protein
MTSEKDRRIIINCLPSSLIKSSPPKLSTPFERSTLLEVSSLSQSVIWVGETLKKKTRANYDTESKQFNVDKSFAYLFFKVFSFQNR